MNQEEPLDLQEQDIKTDKSKKLLTIVIFLFMIWVAYYYYSVNYLKKPEIITQNTANKIIPAQPEIKIQIKQDKPAFKDTAAIEVKTEDKQTAVPNSTIKPSRKSELTRLALAASGKPDPFAENGIKTSPLKNGHTNYTKYGSLPPPPGMMGGLPTISSLPKLSGIPGQTVPPYLYQDNISIKGFIGNKVLLNVDGQTEAVKVNDNYKGVKILSVDPDGMSVRLKKGNEIVSKNLKTLTNLPYSPDVSLVKDFNR